VKILVDANIVFSGILNSNGKIADLLINSSKYFTFISPEFLRYEIGSKYQKLMQLSGMDFSQLREAEYQVCKHITFISEEQITDKCWDDAYALVENIDKKDVHYVAYAKQFKCKLWSGDKKLQRGLTAKGFAGFLTTEELFDIRLKKIKLK
jgi:predicted nucleic acid-binding protein